MNLMEMCVALALSSIAVTMLMSSYLFSVRSFAAVANYIQMDGKSQHAIDIMLREIRESNLVLGFQTNGTWIWLQVANTLASPAVTNTFTWTPSTGLLAWDRTGQDSSTILSGCDNWSFAFYVRGADTNGVFYSCTDASMCKLINMSWKCSRSNIRQKVNTESIITAEVVLRNKS